MPVMWLCRKYLFPTSYVDSVFDINYDKLYEIGIKGLIFDIDNTLVTFDVEKPPRHIIDFLYGLKEKGFGICMLSNNSEARVSKFCEDLEYPHIWRAGKPKLKGILRAKEYLGLNISEIVIIGDQIFTDCLCGNRLGICTILTKPIAKRDEWTVKIKRLPEKPVLKAYKKDVLRNGS